MNFNYLVFLSFISLPVFALEQISETDLEQVTAQAGLSLSGTLSFNENGGPLTSSDAGNELNGNTVWGTCTEKAAATASRCGARVAVGINDGGWIALDELQGGLSFNNLTVRSRDISSTDDFGGDEAAADGKTVLEIGLPSQVKFKDLTLSLAISSNGRPTDTGFQQQTHFGIDLNGTVNMQGNLLIFPAGNP